MTHTHDGHSHSHPPAGEHPPAGGPVVLDIGDETGALIVHLDDHLIGEELHVRPDGATTTIHTGIWPRTANGHAITVAVFAQLPAGTHQLLQPDGRSPLAVTIEPGHVTELHLT